MEFKNIWNRRTIFPLSLTNWPIYAFKIGLSASLSLHVIHLFSIRDLISGCFVATMVTTPTVFACLKRGLLQLLGSFVGGSIAVLFLLLGMEGPLVMFVVISITTLVMAMLRLQQAILVAIFTGIYMISLNFSTPLITWEVRMASVAIGIFSALVVNMLVSAQLYPMLFRRRLLVCRSYLLGGLEELEIDTSVFNSFRPILRQLIEEVDDADREQIFNRKSVKLIIKASKRELDLMEKIVNEVTYRIDRDGSLQYPAEFFCYLRELKEGKTGEILQIENTPSSFWKWIKYLKHSSQ